MQLETVVFCSFFYVFSSLSYFLFNIVFHFFNILFFFLQSETVVSATTIQERVVVFTVALVSRGLGICTTRTGDSRGTQQHRSTRRVFIRFLDTDVRPVKLT